MVKHLCLCSLLLCVLVCQVAVAAERSAVGLSPEGLAQATVLSTSPDVVVDISAGLLHRLLNRQVCDTRAVDEVILGTQVDGEATTVADVQIELIPDDSQVAFSVVVTGAAEATTIGSNGPARVHSSSTTLFTARKDVFFDGARFRATPAVAEANTCTRVERIASTVSGLRGKIVEKVAQQRVAHTQQEVEQLANECAERQITAAFDDQLDVVIDRLNTILNVVPGFAQCEEAGHGDPLFCCRTARDSFQLCVGDESVDHMGLCCPQGDALRLHVRTHLLHDQLCNVLQVAERFHTSYATLSRWLPFSTDLAGASFLKEAVVTTPARMPVAIAASPHWVAFRAPLSLFGPAPADKSLTHVADQPAISSEAR